MPSTRKEKTKERRSRQADLMSDLERRDGKTRFADVMLGSYSRNELESNSGDRNDEVATGPTDLDKT